MLVRLLSLNACGQFNSTVFFAAALRDWYAEPISPQQKLTLKRLVNLVGVKSHNDRIFDDNHRSSHVTKFLKLGQGAGILRYVPLLELYALVRKILFRLIAEHSPALGINDDVLRHFSPPASFGPLASRR